MIEKVLSFVKEYHMIEPGDRVIAGISGGADSVCLLLVLKELQKELDFSLRVLHVEHGIRGEESLRDAEFVKSLCAGTEVEYQCFHVDVPEEAKRRGCSWEETARSLRYEILQREAAAWDEARIAVAHHRQDDAETVLMHLIRGSGLQGMQGILPVRGNLIRPLLHTDREQILNYLKERNQTYCNDSSNSDIRYSRNKIRSQVMPVLRELNGQADAHIQMTADLMKEVFSFVRRTAETAGRDCILKDEEGICIQKEPFLKLDTVIKKEVLRGALYEAAGAERDIGQVHLLALEQLFERQNGRYLDLPYDLVAQRYYDGIRLVKKKRGQERAEALKECVLEKEALEQADGRAVESGPFTVRLLENVNFLGKIPQKTYTKWFDYDKIKSNLLARNRREGDYFVCDEAGHTQKLKRYFVNEKVDAKMRDQTWLFAEGSHILWAVGYRISEYYKVGKETKIILEVRYNGGKEND